jgi:hypothetical protein
MSPTKQDILDATDGGLGVFNRYIKDFPGVGKAFLNPFYEDTKASAYVFKPKGADNYIFFDHGNGDYTGDCFTFIGWVLGKDASTGEGFRDIIQHICVEFQIGDSSGQILPLVKPRSKTINSAKEGKDDPLFIRRGSENQRRRFVEPEYKSFTADELIFWRVYGIAEDTLSQYSVRSVGMFHGVTSDDRDYAISATKEEPIFAYPGNGYVKIYRPFSGKEHRFSYCGNIKDTYTFGIEQLPQRGDVLFLTGGEKDVLSLAAKGFNAICFNSETAKVPVSIIRKLSFRFKHIVILYDMDDTGIRAMNELRESLREFDVKPLALPLSGEKGDKDISDFFLKGHTAQDLKRVFTDLLGVIYDDTMSVLKSFELDFRNPPKPAKAIIRINGVPIGTEGNIMAITGSEGSGKSNYIGALLAGTILEEDEEADLLGMEVATNAEGKAVLFYDTEQSEEQLYRNMQRILKRAGKQAPPEWYKTYGFVGMDRKDRMTSILQSMDKFYYEMGGIHMVIIDGIADLMPGVNDEDSSVGLIGELLRLAGIYKTCIVGVLHLSPSGYKLRGHLGSEVQRKAAGIISIEKDEDPQYSVIKALKVRDGSPLDVPQLIMGWDDERKLHVNRGEKHGDSPSVRKQNELISIIQSVFEKNQVLPYRELVREIMEQLSVQDRTARKYVKTLRESNVITSNSGDTGIYRLVKDPF